MDEADAEKKPQQKQEEIFTLQQIDGETPPPEAKNNQFVQPSPEEKQSTTSKNKEQESQKHQAIQQFLTDYASQLDTFFRQSCDSDPPAISPQQLQDLLGIAFKANKLLLLRHSKPHPLQDEPFPMMINAFLQQQRAEAISYEQLKPFLYYVVAQDGMELRYQEVGKKVTKQEKAAALISQLEHTLNQAKSLLQQRLSTIKDSSSIEITITTIQSIDQQLSNLHLPQHQSLPAVITTRKKAYSQRHRMQRLMMVFEYYCKMEYQEGKQFDNILQQSHLLNLRKFVIFCKDFKLVTKKVGLQQIVAHFKKQARKDQTMDFQGFGQALQAMALLQIEGDQLPSSKIAVYMDSITQHNTRKKIKELHKQPFQRGVEPSSLGKAKFSLQPHTGLLPHQLQDNIRIRNKYREAERSKRMMVGRKQYQSVLYKGTSSSKGEGSTERVIRLQELRESKADKRVIADLIDEQGQKPARRVRWGK